MSQHDSRLASKTRTRWRSGLAILSIGMTMAPAVARAQLDLKAAAAAIMAADRAFNQSVAARDRVKFLSFIVENATFVGTSDMRGHDAILKGWESFFQKDGPTLTWEPTKGKCSWPATSDTPWARGSAVGADPTAHLPRRAGST